jgi:methylmalonyl-CoA/ethylmalonyl-CoA epimerase
LRTHHFGFVVRDIEQAAASFRQLFQVESATPIVHDPRQRVNVAFLLLGGDVRLELIEPAGAGSPIERHLAAGGGLHHICFRTSQLEVDAERLREQGLALVSGPTPAAAFPNRRIVFLYGSQSRLIELLEDEKP